MIRCTPEVRWFGAVSGKSILAEQLQHVNLFAPTQMCRIMTKFGSDKGLHKYTPLYSALFGSRSEQPLRVFELGLGTNHLDVESNMGVFGTPGASHRAWRLLFPNALIYGADIDRRILFEEDRIKTFFCDQLNPMSIRELWSREDLQGGADIIIEDALHTFEANALFMDESLRHLRPNGFYVTEDISWESLEMWQKTLEAVYSKRYPTYEFALVVLEKRGSSNVLVVRRAANQICSPKI
jgi:hypothetical protein